MRRENRCENLQTRLTEQTNLCKLETEIILHISLFIVHSTKLLVSDWTRGVQLIPTCTLSEYLLCFFQNAVFYLLFSCQILSFLI